MLQFYVYAYIRSKDSNTSKAGTPYYIGKGKGNRAYCKKHSVTVPQNKNMIVFLEKNLTDVGACALERRLIRWFGRKDNGTGILYNRTDGGDGGSGCIPNKATRLKMSLSKKGKPLTYTRTEEHKLKISVANKGRKQSAEEIAKRTSKTTGKKRTDEFKKLQSERFKGKPKEYLKGKIGCNKGRQWWNNGIKSKLSLDCPGPEWNKGRISN